MTFLPSPLHENLPVAFGGCDCGCHRTPGVMHCVPCCGPGSARDTAPGSPLPIAPETDPLAPLEPSSL